MSIFRFLKPSCDLAMRCVGLLKESIYMCLLNEDIAIMLHPHYVASKECQNRTFYCSFLRTIQSLIARFSVKARPIKNTFDFPFIIYSGFDIEHKLQGMGPWACPGFLRKQRRPPPNK